MKAIDVFGGLDGFENGVFVYVLWQRQLDEYSVDGMVFISSGYAIVAGASAGNVLLAFGVD